MAKLFLIFLLEKNCSLISVYPIHWSAKYLYIIPLGFFFNFIFQKFQNLIKMVMVFRYVHFGPPLNSFVKRLGTTVLPLFHYLLYYSMMILETIYLQLICSTAFVFNDSFKNFLHFCGRAKYEKKDFFVVRQKCIFVVAEETFCFNPWRSSFKTNDIKQFIHCSFVRIWAKYLMLSAIFITKKK